MSDHGLIEQYEAAIHRFQEHLKPNKDGTFYLDVSGGWSRYIDPVVFADLNRSLEENNRRIRSGEIKASDIRFYPKN